MLITTHAGLVVNSDHVACIVLRRHGNHDLEAQQGYQVLLWLAHGNAIVAASRLTEQAARFLRQDIAFQWAEGARALDVHHSLARHTEGAYFALDAPQSAPTGEGG
jgi:hypothetical protein